jgi:hypothetical protein
MANPLVCDFTLETEKGPTYWWPLIFEAMGWKSFRFTAPDQPEGMGYYYYTRLGNVEDTDFVCASFRATWDEICSETSTVLISFWPREPKSFAVSVSLEQDKSAGRMHLYLILEDAELIDQPLESVRHRLSLTRDCALALYEISRPSTGEISWEKIEVPWASFKKPFERSAREFSTIWGREMRVVEKPLSDGATLYLLDPVPVRMRQEWSFISLVG